MIKQLTNQISDQIVRAYQAAPHRVVCLDYDGTLVDFAPTPAQAQPTPHLLELLCSLSSDSKNTVAIISGRDRLNLQSFFGDLPLFLSAEHGHFIREVGGDWYATSPGDTAWKSHARPIVEAAVRARPGSFIEEKEMSLAWHYRGADADLAELQLPKILAQAATQGVACLAGDKVLEIRYVTSNKAAIFEHIQIKKEDFVLVVGDDLTDESMFASAPPHAFTIKVRPDVTAASYVLNTPKDVLALLTRLLQAKPV